MKIRFVIGQTSVTGTLDGSAAGRDFASLLDLQLDDLFVREKSGQLPRALSQDRDGTYTYEVGDVVYWPPGPLVAVFFRQNGHSLRRPGMIRLGAIDACVGAFAGSSSVREVIERVD